MRAVRTGSGAAGAADAADAAGTAGTTASSDDVDPRPASRARLALFTTAPAALILLGARIWFQTDVTAVTSASTLMSLVSLAHGLGLFVLLGRERVTMAGLFMASSAAIVGISGLLVIPDPGFLRVLDPEAALQDALFLATGAQIGVGALSILLEQRDRVEAVILPDAATRRAQLVGWATLLATIALGDRLGLFLDGFGFSAILLICLAVLLSERGLRSPVQVLLMIAALAAFPLYVIEGTGRLRAIALVLAVGYVFFLRYGTRWLKLLAVLLAPAALAVMGLWRRGYEESLTGQHGNDTGLSSMFVAIGNFGTLIRASQDGLPLTLGASLLSPLGSALPDSLRPDWIPDATGYELAAITDPELYGTGFSTVVSVYGDLWWNFGLVGLVVGVPVLALTMERLDTWTVQSYRHAVDGPRQLLMLVFLAALLGGVGDIVWSGFHTWTVRMFARITALLVLAALTIYLPARLARPSYVAFDGRPRTRPDGAR